MIGSEFKIRFAPPNSTWIRIKIDPNRAEATRWTLNFIFHDLKIQLFYHVHKFISIFIEQQKRQEILRSLSLPAQLQIK